MKTRTLILVATLAATMTAGFGVTQEAQADGLSVRIGGGHSDVHRTRRHARIHRDVHRTRHHRPVVIHRGVHRRPVITHHDVHVSPVIIHRNVHVVSPTAPRYDSRATERLLGERDGYEAGRLSAFADARYGRAYSATVTTDPALHSRPYRRGYSTGFARGYEAVYHTGVSFYHGSLFSVRLF